MEWWSGVLVGWTGTQDAQGEAAGFVGGLDGDGQMDRRTCAPGDLDASEPPAILAAAGNVTTKCGNIIILGTDPI